MRIAVDVMGGDRAPVEIIHGAIEAVRLGRVEPDQLVLVGDREKIEPELELHGGSDVTRIAIEHFPEVVGMQEQPVEAIRRKARCSILGCVELVRSGGAQGLLTAGSTGAAVAAATLHLGLIEGIRRPGIAVQLPVRGGFCTVIDVGANIKCTPVHLFQYGWMAVQYARHCLGVERPTVGLLNIGSEDAKGGELLRKTLELYQSSSLRFIGNVEGQDVFAGRCDVIVCEGFVGNVVLKVSEGIAEYLVTSLHEDIAREAGGSADLSLWHKVHRRMTAKIDYSEYGGAPLLGIDGICIIGHGRSNARAIANAIVRTRDFIERDVNTHIRSSLAV